MAKQLYYRELHSKNYLPKFAYNYYDRCNNTSLLIPITVSALLITSGLQAAFLCDESASSSTPLVIFREHREILKDEKKHDTVTNVSSWFFW